MTAPAACPFVWHDLMTNDVAAASAFYTAVFGWTIVDPADADMPYWHIQADGRPIGGMMAIPDEAKAHGARPGWFGYIGVPDLDAALASAVAAGAQVHKGPTEITDTGRFAILADPQGAIFYLFAPTGEPSGDTPDPMAPGTFVWAELTTPDRVAAQDFYYGQFGWTADTAMPMGGEDVYQLFAIDGQARGAMMRQMSPDMPTGWLFYTGVADVDAALARAQEQGARILHGPSEVPGGAWIVQALDPQGAAFAFVGMRAS
ncbi:VOC family protein [Sphingobium subterraneum]|uniref:VOC domain-containing protein n=1 Tax=Sphingobium subterraneum TaxID=627688 RepID=A0A841J1C8_9SPHN|nr:VOC family protein [Sphingobium subterraneum]MBB6124979.1 hypothetical protein [Sphingobium subterraneum]